MCFLRIFQTSPRVQFGNPSPRPALSLLLRSSNAIRGLFRASTMTDTRLVQQVPKVKAVFPPFASLPPNGTYGRVCRAFDLQDRHPTPPTVQGCRFTCSSHFIFFQTDWTPFLSFTINVEKSFARAAGIIPKTPVLFFSPSVTVPSTPVRVCNAPNRTGFFFPGDKNNLDTSGFLSRDLFPWTILFTILMSVGSPCLPYHVRTLFLSTPFRFSPPT